MKLINKFSARVIFFSLLYFFLLLSFTNSQGAVCVTDSAARSVRAAGNPYPTPKLTGNNLFYIQRDPNSNTIIYDLNVDHTGKLNATEPVHVYWIKYNEHGQKEELNFIQRKFAYGVTSKKGTGDNYDIRFVSYKKFPLTLMRAADGKYHIFALVKNKEVIVNNVFIRIDGGSFWIPNVKYVELNCTDPATGKEFSDRFKP